VLAAQPRLRRLLADPATSADARTNLVGALLDNKVGAGAVDLVKAAVELRWSSPWDLLDAIEWAGDDVLLAAAERENAIDSVEDELFRFERILDNESNLTTLLDEQSATPERRRQLLESVVGQKVHPITLALLQHAVASQRKTSVLLAIDELIESAAKRRERSVARVVSPINLSDEQQQRLAAALTHLYGRRIDVRYAIDPTLLGGLIVHVGDEVIDGSLAARFAQARTAFAR
jgi:F-type H+-transporting ATPase subunit delta